jgi:3-hydroxyanthranilate 3,4-dioxygenase
MERNRPKESIDQLQWYCPNKKAHGEKPVVIRHEQFYCADIETQLKVVIDDWIENEAGRRCKECGETAPPY